MTNVVKWHYNLRSYLLTIIPSKKAQGKKTNHHQNNDRSIMKIVKAQTAASALCKTYACM